jgi:hypothetical protein
LLERRIGRGRPRTHPQPGRAGISVRHRKARAKFMGSHRDHLLSGETARQAITPEPSEYNKTTACCAGHYNAINRYERRLADRHCSCRGLCGCRVKVQHNG